MINNGQGASQRGNKLTTRDSEENKWLYLILQAINNIPGSSSGTCCTLDQVLTQGNITTQPIVIGPPGATSTAGFTVRLGENFGSSGDQSGDLRLRDVAVAGVYNHAVHAYASSALDQAAIHMFSGPSNASDYGIGLVTTTTSANIEVNDPSGNTVSLSPTAITITDVTNSAGNHINIVNKVLTGSQVQSLPDTTGIIEVAKYARAIGQTSLVASVGFRIVGAVDASYIVTANVLVTTATSHNFTVVCNYTDEGNTARSATFNFSNVGGTLSPTIANTGGAVPYMSLPLHIRCKAATSLSVATTGTFTTVVYNIETSITQVG